MPAVAQHLLMMLCHASAYIWDLLAFPPSNMTKSPTHCGSPRNSGSKDPRMTVGLSTRSATSSSRSCVVASGIEPAQSEW